MLRVGSQPAIRQQGFQGSRIAWGDGRNPTQHIGQVRPHVHAVPPSTLHQRVERRRRLATMLASEKQVIFAIMLISTLSELCEVQDYANHAMPLCESGWAFAPQPRAFVWLNFA